MIECYNNGWSVFRIGDFKASLDWETDVPIIMLDLFLKFHKVGYGIVNFRCDREVADTNFSLILTPERIIVIQEKYEFQIYNLTAYGHFNLEKELVSDIEDNLTKWVKYIKNGNEKDFVLRGIKIKKLLDELKEFTIAEEIRRIINS